MKKYNELFVNWIDNINNLIDNINLKQINDTNMIDCWHRSYDLKQIKDLPFVFENKFITFLLKTSQKKYSFKPILPDTLYDNDSYKSLINKRAELNYYKRVMDTKPSNVFGTYYDKGKKNLLTWEDLTNELDPYKGIKFKLRELNVEMPTNAWMKMFEILSNINGILPMNQHNLKTFHLCEAPGSFISAINHYLSDKNINWQWYAQTLKPEIHGKFNDALEDHYGLIKQYPDKWIFGDSIMMIQVILVVVQ